MVWIGGRLSPGTSVLSKASLPWYAQNPLQGCRRFTGSQRDGMLVKTELKRGEWRTSSKPNLPYHQVHVHKIIFLPDNAHILKLVFLNNTTVSCGRAKSSCF